MIGASFCYLLVWGFFAAKRMSGAEIHRQIRIQRFFAIITLVSAAVMMALDGSQPAQWLVYSLGFFFAAGFYVTTLGTVIGGFLVVRREHRKTGTALLGVGALMWLILIVWGEGR